MNTTFTFKATQATGEAKDKQYKVTLGRSILNGLSEDTINKLAERTKIVELQNTKGSLLRASENIEGAEATLEGFGYEDATVEVYVPTAKPHKELTVEDVQKALKSGRLTKNDIEDMLTAIDVA